VVASNEPLNITYADDKLPLHMDQVYYEGQPGLQLLHTLQKVIDIIQWSPSKTDTIGKVKFVLYK